MHALDWFYQGINVFGFASNGNWINRSCIIRSKIDLVLLSWNMKSLHIVGLKLSMCWTHYLVGKHSANPMIILVHLQFLWLHNAYQFNVLLQLLPSDRNLKGVFESPNSGFRGRVKGSGFVPNESPHMTTNFCTIGHRFTVISTRILCAPRGKELGES